MAAYCASKAALDHFAACLMLEVRQQGVKVTTIAPGSVDTSFGGDPASARRRRWMLTADDVAGRPSLDLLRTRDDAHLSRVEMRPLRPAEAGVIRAGRPRIAWRAFMRFQDHNGPDRAAAVAYYTLLSLLPAARSSSSRSAWRSSARSRRPTSGTLLLISGVVVHLDRAHARGAAHVRRARAALPVARR